jgi:hypothetical protein
MGPVRERLELLAQHPFRAGCAEAGASRRNAIAYYRAMNSELKGLLATSEGQSLRAEEEVRADELRRKRLSLPPDPPFVARDLDAAIASLETAHDGELYERVKATREQQTVTMKPTPADKPGIRSVTIRPPPPPSPAPEPAQK